MQKAFIIREAIVSLFEDHNVEDSFFDFFFAIFRENDLNILFPSGRASSFKKFYILLLQGSLNATQCSKADLTATLNRQ